MSANPARDLHGAETHHASKKYDADHSVGRCLMSVNGKARERERVGIECAEACERRQALQPSLNRHKRQRVERP